MLKITGAKAVFREFLGVLRSGVWFLEGTEQESNEPLKILFAGSHQQKAHLTAIAFRGQCSEHYCGKLCFWKILYLLRTNRSLCDIAIIEGARMHRSLYQNTRDFFLPIWLKTKVAIPMLVLNRSYKEDRRRIGKFALSYEVTGDDDRVDDFYHNMYRPAVNASHGESTIEIDYDEMKSLLARNKCVLLLVLKDGISIAGVLIRMGVLPRLWAIGVRGNDPEYRKYSANTAAYHFGSEYLSQQGYEAMHLGMSRAFLNDGILQYKNKFDQQVIGTDNSGFVLKVLRASAGSDAFLINNPFVYLKDEKLYGMSFLARDHQPSEKDQERIRQKYLLKGLSGLTVMRQGDSVGAFERLLEY